MRLSTSFGLASEAALHDAARISASPVESRRSLRFAFQRGAGARNLAQPVALRPMPKTVASEERFQTLGEEIANSVSSGVALLAILCGIPFLCASAIPHGALNLVGVIVFATSMVLLYLASTIYHALPRTKIKRLFRLFDHSAIYLLIAGTYTPFALGPLRSPSGWILLGAVWCLAVAGIGFRALAGLRHRWVSICLYIGMGWMAVFAVRAFWVHVPLPGLILLAAGGIAYTGGVGFYLAKQIRYGHFIWHLFVAAGTACHFCAVLWYAS
jgi:hemolysin III